MSTTRTDTGREIVREGAERERERERDGQPPAVLAVYDGPGSEGAIEEEMIEKQKEKLSKEKWMEESDTRGNG